MINNHEVDIKEFAPNEAGAVYGSKNIIKYLTKKIGENIIRNETYFSDDSKKYGFQVALDKQVLNLILAIESENADKYKPVSYNALRMN